MPSIPNYVSRFRTQSQSTAATSNTSQSGSHPRTPGPEFATLSEESSEVGPVVVEDVEDSFHPHAKRRTSHEIASSSNPGRSKQRSGRVDSMTSDIVTERYPPPPADSFQASPSSSFGASSQGGSFSRGPSARVIQPGLSHRHPSASNKTQRGSSTPIADAHSSSRLRSASAPPSQPGPPTATTSSSVGDQSSPGRPCLGEGSSSLSPAHIKTSDRDTPTAYTKRKSREDFFTPTRTSTPPPPERMQKRDPPHTYPQRSRKRSSDIGSSVSFPSLRRGSIKQSTAKTRAEDIFKDVKNAELEANDTGRRQSADWSAMEAIRGDVGGVETWPSSVSKEMVRLALGDTKTSISPNTSLTSSADNSGELGVIPESSKNPTIFGSVGADRRHFHNAAGRKSGRSLSAAIALHSSQPFGLSSVVSSRSSVHDRSSSLGDVSVPQVSVTAATPIETRMRTNALSDPGPSNYFGRDLFAASAGKRKMTESQDEIAPPEIGTRSILIKRTESSTRPSDAAHAPSSYRQPKRIRLSTPPPHNHSTRSLSSRHSLQGSPPSRPASSLRTLPVSSNATIPLRAFISPKPPSIERSSSIYHMRDPALGPPKRQSVQWTGGARKVPEEGRRVFPLQGWAFILGFIAFPLWWLAAVLPLEWGWGHLSKQDGKGVWSEEEIVARQVIEYDVALAWRRRCRLMSLVGLVFYVPIIVLLAVLVPRG